MPWSQCARYEPMSPATHRLVKINLEDHRLTTGLKVRGARGLSPHLWNWPYHLWCEPLHLSRYRPLTVIVISFPWASAPWMTTLIWTKTTLGIAFLCLPEMQVLCVGIHLISASRLFHGLDPAVAKSLSPTFTRRVVARRTDPMKCQPDDVG
jgi:hypothetical protein